MLDKHDLDEITSRGCTVPGCTCDSTTLVLTSKCHPGKGTDVSYTKDSGELMIVCHVCKEPVLEIKVGV